MKPLNIDKNIEAMKHSIEKANSSLKKAWRALGFKGFYFYAKLPKGFERINQ